MDLDVQGPKVFVRINELFEKFGAVFGNLVTQTTVSLAVVTVLLIVLALISTRKLTKRPGKFQVIVEKLVTMLYDLVEGTMGKHNAKFAPYIGTLFLSSIIGTLIGTTQIFRSTTADLSVTAAWAIVTSVMVWVSSIKNNGFKAWLKGFTEPIFVMTPMNIVSEIAQPLSLAFRHFGNVAGGSVLTSLIYAALAGLNTLVFGWLPEAIFECLPPVFTAGIPAVLSIYFDLFAGFVQALVFTLLTMVYVGAANPPPPEKEEESASVSVQ